ncbi:MAG: protein-methionine-sulfoxide reductase heme-binding subunit MsrQ [Paracoccaceae bacterium]
MPFADLINTNLRRVPCRAVYIVCAIPALLLFFGLLTGGLGVDPIRRLELELGEWALRLVIAGLCITPLRRWGGINALGFRRAIGVMAFVYVLLHLMVWLVLDMGLRGDQIWKDILKRRYITIGMVGFLMLLPLAVTSNDISLRRLGSAAWQRLHRLVYPAALAGGLHFVLIVKGWPVEPMVYMAIILSLLAMRAVPRQATGRRASVAR